MDSYSDMEIEKVKNRDGEIDRFKIRICIAIVRDRDTMREN